MNLTPEQWEVLSRRLDEGLELPESARRAWVANLTDLDQELKRTLDELLRKSTGHDTGDLVRTLPSIGVDAVKEQAGRIFGPYRLLRELGRGGMGAVWLAERSDGVLKRPVALKLPHLLIYGDASERVQFFERFHRERDIVASLAHPNIASLYDAGVSADGQPYIALEYIEGATLTAFCDEHRLNVQQRIELFLKVLAAVQHAHGHLVLHRDLKPSNILVTSHGEVKLLDFGIAKLMTDGEARETELTQIGGRALTLDYASPEQISGEPMSTASDVYSLGVVLFELLSGDRPYTLKRDSKGALEDAILSAEIGRPSQAVKIETKAAARASTVRKLVSTLKGDLDTIVLKALKRHPADRYATADAFAQDLQRYLDGEAVLARPESASYRAKKFILRHKLPVLASASVVAALAIGLGVALHQTRVANEEARTSRAVEKFMEDIFRANTADQTSPALGRTRTARDLLDAGAHKIDSELNDAPAAKVRALQTVARMYMELGLDDDAVVYYRKRVDLAKSAFGPRDPEVGLALTELAGAMHSSQSADQEGPVLLEAKEFMDRRKDFDSLDRALLMDKLASLYRNSDLHQALEYAKEAARIYRMRRDSDPKEARNGVVEALYTEGVIYNGLGEFEQALPVLAEAIASSRKLNGDTNYTLARLYAYEGQANEGVAQFAAAEKSYKHAYDTARTINGGDHVDTVQTGMRLGSFLVNTSRQKEGLEYLQKALETVLRIRGPEDSFHTPQVLTAAGNALARHGEIEAALADLTQAVQNRRKFQPGTAALASVLEDQASVLVDLGKLREAAAALEEARTIREKNQDKSSAGIAARVKFLLASGKAPDASGLLTPAISESKTLSMARLRDLQLRANVALALLDANRAGALAAEIRKQVEGSQERPLLAEPEASAALAEGRASLLLNQADKSQPLLARAVELRSQLLAASSPSLGEAYVALAECYLAKGDTGRARSAAAEARAIFNQHKQLGPQYTRPLQTLLAKLGA